MWHGTSSLMGKAPRRKLINGRVVIVWKYVEKFVATFFLFSSHEWIRLCRYNYMHLISRLTPDSLCWLRSRLWLTFSSFCCHTCAIFIANFNLCRKFSHKHLSENSRTPRRLWIECAELTSSERRNFETKSRISYENRRNRFFNFRYFFRVIFLLFFSVLWARKIRKRNRQSRDEKERKVSAENSLSPNSRISRARRQSFLISSSVRIHTRARKSFSENISEEEEFFSFHTILYFFSLSPHKNILYFPLTHPKKSEKNKCSIFRRLRIHASSIERVSEIKVIRLCTWWHWSSYGGFWSAAIDDWWSFWVWYWPKGWESLSCWWRQWKSDLTGPTMILSIDDQSRDDVKKV